MVETRALANGGLEQRPPCSLLSLRKETWQITEFKIGKTCYIYLYISLFIVLGLFEKGGEETASLRVSVSISISLPVSAFARSLLVLDLQAA